MNTLIEHGEQRMPITCPLQLQPPSQAEFQELDFRVMELAFASQNELGRLCDEVIYQHDLRARIEAAGITATREVPISVTHSDFTKIYSVDLIVGAGSLYELKTASQIAQEHENQLLNYLLLAGGSHGKVVNFRTGKVTSRFVNTNLTQELRREFTVHTSEWRSVSAHCELLKSRLLALIQDWGLFLELPLYVEALIHFFGGRDNVIQPVPFSRAGASLGSQPMAMLEPETAFRLTALADTTGYRRQLASLLRLTPLRHVQWINMNRHVVEFVTLSKS